MTIIFYQTENKTQFLPSPVLKHLGPIIASNAAQISL